MVVFMKVLLVIVCVGLIAVVLLQKGKSAGLGAISGGAEHLFGKQKARGMDLFLSRLTMILAALFIIVSMLVAFFVNN